MRIQKSNIDPTPTLYLVPTPIGNMLDMTFRSIEVLKQVDIILCEENRKDVSEIADQYLKGLNLHFVHDISEVLSCALEK